MFSDRLTIHYLYAPDQGYRVAAARNRGASIAIGDILVFIDSDVLLEPTALERHRDRHARGTDLVVIGRREEFRDVETRGEWIANRLGEAVREGRLREVCREIGLAGDLRDGKYREMGDLTSSPCPWSVFFTNNVSVGRVCFNRVGGFDEDFISWGIEDVELGYRLWRNGCRFEYEPEALGYHHPHPRDVLGQAHTNRDNRLLAFQKHPHYDMELFATVRGRYFLRTLRYINALRAARFLPDYSLLLPDLRGFVRAKTLMVGFPTETVCALKPVTSIGFFSDGFDYDLIGVRTPFKTDSFDVAIVSDIWRALPFSLMCKLFDEMRRVTRFVILSYQWEHVAAELYLETEEALNLYAQLNGLTLHQEKRGGIWYRLEYPQGEKDGTYESRLSRRISGGEALSRLV